MSIYKEVMGNDFYRLHPMLQKRYAFVDSFKATGVMSSIQGGPGFLFPFFLLGTKWKLLFPERGTNIPFTMTNKAQVGRNKEAQVHWERIFYFGGKKRFFNALMSLDTERMVIKDYLGEPSLFYSDLLLSVTGDGHLVIASHRQRLILGKIELPLPKVLQSLATVTEKYSDTDQNYHIHVVVKNPLIGTVFAYEGTFSADDIS